MGFQDRDYYRAWWAKKEGYVEKSPLRMNLGQAAKKQARSWHPVLTVLATFFVCVGIFFLLKFFVRIQALLF